MAEQFMRFPVKEEYLSASLSSHPVIAENIAE